MTKRSKSRARGESRAALFLLVTPFFSGCGGRDIASQTARHLHADLAAYEVRLNERIAHEKNMYDERLAMIRQEENDLLTSSFEEVRRHRSAEMASALAADPERQVQIGDLIRFLNESVQAEYGLYQRLHEKETSAATEFDLALAKLDQHRERLAQIEEQVAALATRSKLRTNSQLMMENIDELLDQLESDQRSQTAARRKGRMSRASRTAPRASDASSRSRREASRGARRYVQPSVPTPK